VIGLANRSAIGILLAQSAIQTNNLQSKSTGFPNKTSNFFRVFNEMEDNPYLPNVLPPDFILACHDCSLILLSHASCYSMKLVHELEEKQDIKVMIIFLDKPSYQLMLCFEAIWK